MLNFQTLNASYDRLILAIKSKLDFEEIDKNVKYYFLSFSPTLNAG